MCQNTLVGRSRTLAVQAPASFRTRSVPMSSTYAPSGQSVDIGYILDDGPWTTMQKLVVILAALSIVADGFDGQLIGFAIPLITKEWGVTRGDFAPVVASGLIGMGIGSACAGRRRYPIRTFDCVQRHYRGC